MPGVTRTGKVMVGCVGLGTALMLCGLLAIVIFAFNSCAVNRYIIAADLPAPDAGYVTGTVFGYNIYIWDCYQGKRVVLYNESGEMWSGPFKREETTCGGHTPIEEKLKTERDVRQVDPKKNW